MNALAYVLNRPASLLLAGTHRTQIKRRFFQFRRTYVTLDLRG